MTDKCAEIAAEYLRRYMEGEWYSFGRDKYLRAWSDAIRAAVDDVNQRTKAAEDERDRLAAALNKIAAWHEGAEVTSAFDEPCAARLAREALDKSAAADSPDVVAVPREPTFEMVKAMAESVARDDEGEFPPLFDLLGFSGENKTHTALKEAYRAIIRAADQRGWP